ncbi:MAG: T9SS type A sorting domain-containing protein [Bacteriodetes bacterium]|nr:T9SS type A sorting domain-containing protein [Bacteroidota bacterium]
MKTVCVLLALLGITTTFCFSQTPVPLEEWLVSKGYPDSSFVPPKLVGVTSGFSTVESFMKSKTPPVVIGYRYKDGGYISANTWLNRFQGDTVSQFNWGSGYSASGIISFDYNGDGNVDYMNGNGRLYLGDNNGLIDTNKRFVYPDHPHIRAGSRKNTYGDINGDSKDDIFYYHHASSVYPYLVTLIFGSEDMSTIQTTKVSSPLLADSSMHEVSVVLYKNKQNKWRLITYTYGIEFIPIPPPGRLRGIPEFASIRMYDVTIQPKQDSNIVTLTLLDNYKDPDWLDSQFYLNATSPVNTDGGGALYNNKQYSDVFFYAITAKYENNNTYTRYYPVFSIGKDKFELKNMSRVGSLLTEGIVLDHSIDGDSLEDVCYNQIPGSLTFYRINENGIPVETYSWKDTNNRHQSGMSDVYSIGDVNGDGISEIAVLLRDSKKGNTFVIILGKDLKTVSVKDVTNSTLTIGLPYPVPTQKDVVEIPISLPDYDRYSISIYSLQGELIQQLWQSDQSIGNLTVPLNISKLPTGVYVLRLHSTTRSTDRLITITK